MKVQKGKVFVGLSGGVDSAVSAALLQQQGYDVTGVFIRIVIPGYPCTAGEDKIDAQRVAAHLRIPFIEVDLSEAYKKEVFDVSVQEFSKGFTPNPDTLCNQKIKFGAFYEFAKSQGAGFIATGHYARTEQGKLLTGADADKDQSYFLWMLPETVLRFTLFPVGGLHKKDVRVLAEKLGLPNARRKDSQGLCFLGDISISEMLERELVPKAGNVLDEDGKVIGTHHGAITYTLGQRHGFELSVQDGSPHYVVGKDVHKNTITVSTSPFPREATGTHITLGETNWIGEIAGGSHEARFRYRQALMNAQLDTESSIVALAVPQYAPVGQSLVLYDGERCLGGGIIVDTKVS